MVSRKQSQEALKRIVSKIIHFKRLGRFRTLLKIERGKDQMEVGSSMSEEEME